MKGFCGLFRKHNYLKYVAIKTCLLLYMGKARPGVALLTAAGGCPAADPTPGCRPCAGAWPAFGCCCAGPAPALVGIG